MKKIVLLLILYFGLSNLKAQTDTDSNENRINALWDEGIKLNEDKNHEQALLKFDEAIKLWDDYFIIDIDYAYLLTYFGSSLYKLNRFDEALNTYLKSLQIIKEQNGEKNHDYINVLLEVSNCFRSTGKIKESLDTHYYAIKLRAEVNGEKNHFGIQAFDLSRIAKEYKSLSLYNKAIAAYKDALIFEVKWEHVESLDYQRWFYELVKLVQLTNSYTDLIPFYLEQLEYKKNTLGENNEKYLNTLSNLIFAYTETGNIKDALPLSQQNVTLTKSFYGEDHFEYGRAVEKLGLAYQELGDLQKAKLELENALKIKANYKNEELDSYTYTLNYLALLETELLNYGKALGLYKEALGLVKTSKGTNSSEFLTLQNNIANTYSSKGEHQKAINIFEQNLIIEENLYGKKHHKYATTLNNLSIAYSELEQHEKAILNTKESLAILSELYGEEDFRCQEVLNNLATLYAKNKDYEKSVDSFIKVVNNTYSQIDDNFSFLSISQKQKYLKNKLRLDILSHNIKSLNHDTNYQYTDLIDLALNSSLNRKGLILNSSRETLLAIESHSRENNQKIFTYRDVKMFIEKQDFLPEAYRFKSYKESKDNLNMLQNKIGELYKSIFSKQTFELIDWKSIPLKENDIAVEFDRFIYYKNLDELTGDTFYIAYVIKKGWETPKVIPLFKENELIKLFESKSSVNSLYSIRGAIARKVNTLDYGIYDLVIKPLEDYLTNSSNVYYSPVGLLHKVPFAALQNSEGQLLSDVYNLNQLNSIASIKSVNKSLNKNGVLLIGGVDYNNENVKHNEEVEFDFDYKTFFNTEKNNPLGTDWSFLQGTLDEVNQLSNRLDQYSVVNDVITGENATEAHFKSLSSSSPSILHIATHGYFFEQEKSENKDEHNFKVSEDPLIRSGLILAGANFTWKNGGNPFFSEDGILTALEISNLDLSSTDMVVLSACETGLGDIDGNEGVYGLQRAFKMAGVDIIVMSLWQVPDKETSEFMQLFYSNWLGGMKVRDAFRDTQRTMSTKYKNNPEKWAAFVLFE